MANNQMGKDGFRRVLRVRRLQAEGKLPSDPRGLFFALTEPRAAHELAKITPAKGATTDAT